MVQVNRIHKAEFHRRNFSGILLNIKEPIICLSTNNFI